MKIYNSNTELLSDDMLRDIVGGDSGPGGGGPGGGGPGTLIIITDRDNNIVYQGDVTNEPKGIAKNFDAKIAAGVWTYTIEHKK